MVGNNTITKEVISMNYVMPRLETSGLRLTSWHSVLGAIAADFMYVSCTQKFQKRKICRHQSSTLLASGDFIISAKRYWSVMWWDVNCGGQTITTTNKLLLLYFYSYMIRLHTQSSAPTTTAIMARPFIL